MRPHGRHFFGIVPNFVKVSFLEKVHLPLTIKAKKSKGERQMQGKIGTDPMFCQAVEWFSPDELMDVRGA